MTLSRIAADIGGTRHDADPAAIITEAVTFGSRYVVPGGAIVCLPGERVDVHDYAAIEVGAVAVIASRPVGVPAIVVGNPLAT